MFHSPKFFTTSLVVIFIVIFVRTAWVGDDGYITLRTVDNFVNGYGLRWNIAERVQSYTHPLWLILLVPVYALTQQAYFTVLFVSFVCSLAAFLLIRYKTEAPLFPLLILLLSKAFMDYSASGLENPATHLLMVVFWICLLELEKNTTEPKDLFPLSLTAAFLVLNRLDVVLFVAPVFAFLLYKNANTKTLISFAWGFLPLLIWEVFSLFYYGFLFPNTYYAKLNTSIPHAKLIEQGFVFFIDSFQRDPLTLTIIFSGILIALWRSNKTYEKLLALGNLIYLSYILWIGGDFMSGRFLTTSLLLSAMLLARNIYDLSSVKKMTVGMAIVILGFLASPSNFSFNLNQPPFTEHDLKTGINDERAFYYPVSGLLLYRPGRSIPFTDEGWGEHGVNLREKDVKVTSQKNVGFIGYFAGPGVYIIDQYALCDPLLARLPATHPDEWRIGHFERDVPKGYQATLRTGQNQIQDPNLAAYYENLSLIIRGPLWSRSRLQTILEMNLGKYDHFLSKYIHNVY